MLMPLNAASQTTAPVDQWIEAEYFSVKSGGTFTSSQDREPAIAIKNLGNGDWVRFDSVDFMSGEFDSVALWAWWEDLRGSAAGSAAATLRLDSLKGQVIASIDFTNIAPSDILHATSKPVATALAHITGIHSLFVIFSGTNQTFWVDNHKFMRGFDKIHLWGTATISPAEARTYYVAVNGSDAADGLTLQTPFRTIRKAAAVMKPGNRCLIRTGIYRETVRPVFSGFPGAPLSFEAYNGENVVISGADPITGWTQHSGSIYKASMRSNFDIFHDQIIVDGKMAWLARCPNMTQHYIPDPSLGECGTGCFNWENFQKIAEPIVVPTRVCFDRYGARWTNGPGPYSMSITSSASLPSGLVNRPTDFFKGALLTQQNCGVALSWGIITGSRSTTTSTVVDAVPGSSMSFDGFGPGWISGLLDLLDSPNEWFRKDSTLYLCAPDGGDPSHHLVEAKRRMLGFDLRNKAYVNLTGLRFLATSITLEHAGNCVIDRCHFKYVSHFDTVSFWDCGAGYLSSPFNPADGHAGVFVSGHDNIVKNSSVAVSAGSGIIVSGMNNTVTNCRVKECDYTAGYHAGILVIKRDILDPYEGFGITLSHNSLSWCMRAAIQVGQASGPINGTKRMKIEYNDFVSSAYVNQETGSLAGQMSKGVEVSHNWFHGSGGHRDNGDIVMEYDFGAQNWIVHHNVFWQGSFAAGEIALPRVRGRSWTFDWNDPNAMCFNNTVVDSNQTLHRDHELLISPDGTRPLCVNKNNIWAKCDTAPWKFTDPVKRDYSLRAGSPAIDAGDTVTGWVETFKGSHPDLGAYEFGETPWPRPGADWQEVPWMYPPDPTAALARGPGANAGIRQRPAVMQLTHAIRIDAPRREPCIVRIFDTKGALRFGNTMEKGGVLTIQTAGWASGVYVIKTVISTQQFCGKCLIR
jgi:hypothetical protein